MERTWGEERNRSTAPLDVRGYQGEIAATRTRGLLVEAFGSLSPKENGGAPTPPFQAAFAAVASPIPSLAEPQKRSAVTDRSMEGAVAAFIERRSRADGDFIEVLAETCREFQLREPGLGFVSQYGIQYARLESTRGYAEAAEFLAGCLLLRHRKLAKADKQAKVQARVKKAQGRASSTIRVRGIGDKLAFPVPELGNARYRFGKSASTQRKRRRRAGAANDVTRALSREIPPLPKTVGQKVKRMLRGDPRAVHRHIEQLPKAWRLPLFRAMRRRPDGSYRSLSDPAALNVFGLFMLFTQGAGKGVRGRRTQYAASLG